MSMLARMPDLEPPPESGRLFIPYIFTAFATPIVLPPTVPDEV
jgi:hypothetical protein